MNIDLVSNNALFRERYCAHFAIRYTGIPRCDTKSYIDNLESSRLISHNLTLCQCVICPLLIKGGTLERVKLAHQPKFS